MTDITNITDINKLNAVAGGLVRDRTQADADYALYCKLNHIYTEEDLRGAYNISDRNRVGAAVNHLAACILNARIYEIKVLADIKENWTIYDIAKPEDNKKVLDSLSCLKKLLLSYDFGETKEVPDNLDCLTYREANILEDILFELYGVCILLLDSRIYCGDGFLSDFDTANLFHD